ncbi:target of Sbf [Elasticomyces elasticus]|nr:target of Sbf [Elasticomyces elasticus]
MRYLLTAAALIAATLPASFADHCSEGSSQDALGNWYCQPVKAITYTGVGGKGSYNKITNMDSTSGKCSSFAYGYSGSMSPLDEEVSLHFRGPLRLKQFAVYTPGSSGKKARRGAHGRRHGHAHFHEHNNEVREAEAEAEAEEAMQEKRAVGDIVVATINGQVVSWTNQYSGQPATSAAAASTSTGAKTTVTSTLVQAAAQKQSSTSAAASSAAASSAAPSSAASSSSSSSSAASGSSWGQIAYYNSAQGSAKGVTFLNHLGGSGSGVFDYTFGNSLSYSSADGTKGASSAQVLSDTMLPSNVEVVIMSDKKCGDTDCGYTRPQGVSYHGFDGAKKAFFFEFSMPKDGNTGVNGDMPAIWMLNAQIPRTLQYGKAECSCWTTGCGEFDIFEVLQSGYNRCKSTLHGNVAGGDSDYFDRPTDGTIKAALILYDDNIHIKILDNSVTFGPSMSSDDISAICSSTSTQSKTVSLFALAGK